MVVPAGRRMGESSLKHGEYRGTLVLWLWDPSFRLPKKATGPQEGTQVPPAAQPP